MSGLFKAIGKGFKKVVRVVKKVAVPALVIGAAVLTGGAALGLALPSIGGVASSLGLGALAPALTAAGQGALVGGGLAAVTGGNVLKGATAGFLTAGAMSGVSSALTPAASGAGSSAGGAAGNAASGAAQSGAGSGFAASSAATAPSNISDIVAAATGNTAPSIGGAATTAAAGGAASSGGGFLSGIGDFVGSNPIVAGQLISGVGAGLAANEERKAIRKQREEDRAAIEANYAGLADILGQDTSTRRDSSGFGQYFDERIYGNKKYAYNAAQGRVTPVG